MGGTNSKNLGETYSKHVAWVCMSMHEYAWVCMSMHEYAWVAIAFSRIYDSWEFALDSRRRGSSLHSFTQSLRIVMNCSNLQKKDICELMQFYSVGGWQSLKMQICLSLNMKTLQTAQVFFSAIALCTGAAVPWLEVGRQGTVFTS